MDFLRPLKLASELTQEGLIPGWSTEANLGAKLWIKVVNVKSALQIGDDPRVF